MPTRRVTVAHADEGTPPPGADAEAWHALTTMPASATPEESAEEDAAGRVRALLGGNAGDGVRVSIFRRTPFRKTLEWCADYSPDQFIEGGLPLIHADLGPGAYEWRAIGRTGNLGRGHFEIAANARKAEADAHAAPAAASHATDAMARALETIAAGQAAILQALTQRPDPSADMLRTMEMMKAMREAMGLGGPQTAPVAAAPPTSLLEQLNTLKALREFASDMGEPKESDPDNPMSYITPILETVKTALQSRTQAPAAESPTMPALSLPPSVAQAAAPDDNQEMLTILFELTKRAKANADTAQAGQWLYETLPDSGVPLLRADDAIDRLCAFSPPLGLFRPWLEKVRADALARFAAAGM